MVLFLYKVLKIEEYIRAPITAKSVIIWDDGKSTDSPIKLLNAIWTITVNEILRTTDLKKIYKTTDIANLINRGIKTITKAYPQNKIAQ